MTRKALMTTAVLLCAASMLVFGFWAYFAPESFIDFVDYYPYNEHLTHDAGAFQIGIGATLLFGLVWKDTTLVVLAGFVVASGLHTLSHYLDRHIGGHSSDVPTLGVFVLVALIAIIARIRMRRAA
ncbi:hypothetical protein [Amycolatopsis taiwanensis]|uniref:hypothetical protein n=1 Tax=Amycolatopsis taiwanensis TaxID=342230 RepID=UPI0005C1676D|nr:hypothetical protein [Amycolatopsis taiwanensis]